MKKFTVIGLLLLLVGVALVVMASKDVSTYMTFTDAESSNRAVRIAGQLSLDKPMEYDAEVDENLFSFYMKDGDNVERKVELLMPKPTDFERSEQIVLTGKMRDGVFVAHEIQMKCPSKYKDEEIQLRQVG